MRRSVNTLLGAVLSLFATFGLTHSAAAQTTACIEPSSGLVSWWRAEGNALDSVSGNNGTLQNGATFAPGKVGQAFSLNGANQYVLIGDPVPPSLQIQNELTLSAWIYATAYPFGNVSDVALIVGSQYDANQAGASIFLDARTDPDGQIAPSGHIHFQIGDGSFHTANANAQVPLNQWVHVVATRKANEDAKIYYNGVLQPSTSVPWSGAISYSGAWFTIGQQKDYNRPFRGLIDEPDIYNRALTAAEVAAIYSAGSAGKCVAPVPDSVPPTITCPPAVTVQGSVNVPPANFVGGSVSDDQDPNPTVTHDGDVISGTCPITIVRTYKATDASGNSDTCTQTITVNNLFASDAIIWHQPLARNGASEDTDPSAGRTVKYRFKRGSTIPIQIHALNCAGTDVTSNANVIGKVTVFGDSNCDGVADANAQPIEFNGVGGGGGVMDKIGGHLKYNLDTKTPPTTTQCYILRVTVTDTSTGDEKFEEVLLQAK